MSFPDAGNFLCKFVDGKPFRELVEDAQIALINGILHRQIDALERVFQVQVAAGLTTFAVNRQRHTGHGLHEKPVQDGPEDIVVMKIRDKPFIGGGLFSMDAVYGTLHQIGDADTVCPHVKPQEVNVENLGGVIQRAGGAGVQELVLAPLVLDLDPSFLDIYVRRAVFAHGAPA